jgi:subtilisin
VIFTIQSEVLEVQNTAPTQKVDWGISLVQAPSLWHITKGSGIKVAILDTGIDNRHPDISNNFTNGVNFTTNNLNDHMDRQGHGTHVAGIIAGTNNDFGIVGVAPEAELYSVKVLGDDGSGSIEGIVKGIDWAISQEMDIISMSLGTSVDPGSYFHNAIKRARAAGIVIVAASGNENTSIGWPAAYDEVIAVGAVNQAMSRAMFSNFGDELDIAAPGVNILSTYLNDSYAKLSGTSMATPIVAGVVALIQSFCRKQGIKATPEKIVQLISERSVDLGETGDDDAFGNGLVNVYKLLASNNNNPK